MHFGSKKQDFLSFLLNQTWRKPRDIVRFLKCYAKINPKDEVITEDGTKKCLNEYARISAVELLEQLSVDYEPKILEGIRNSIRKSYFADASELMDVLSKKINGQDMERMIDNLYQTGLIGNIDRSASDPRYFFYHRQEENIDPEMGIMVHMGLWKWPCCRL